MFHIFNIKDMLSCSPKICFKMNLSYEHFAEYISQSLGCFALSVKVAIDTDMNSTSSC